jgi:hypothetical protein
MRGAGCAGLALILAALLLPAKLAWAGQTESPKPQPTLPEAQQNPFLAG